MRWTLPFFIALTPTFAHAIERRDPDALARYNSAWLESGMCEHTADCKVLSQYADHSRRRLTAKPKVLGGELPPIKVVATAERRQPIEVRRIIVCNDPVPCHHVVTYDNGVVEEVSEDKIYPKRGVVREIATQLVIKAVGFVSGPFAPITTTLACTVVRTDFGKDPSPSDHLMTAYKCSPFGFIVAQQYAINDAERTFMITNGLIGLAGIANAPLPTNLYRANSIAGTYAPAVPWKKLGTKKQATH